MIKKINLTLKLFLFLVALVAPILILSQKNISSAADTAKNTTKANPYKSEEQRAVSSSTVSSAIVMEEIPGQGKPGNFYDYISAIYKFGIGAVGVCAMLMIIIGGYMYITSAGNNASMEKAKGVITDAVVGLLIAFSSYLILYVINPDLVKIKKLKPISSVSSGLKENTTTPTKSTSLATGCDNYEKAFADASGGDKIAKCLLIAIANAESSCNPSVTSSAGACGLMQLLPETAKISCEELKNDPNKSISLAKKLLDDSKATLSKYSGFDIGSSYKQSGSNISYGSYSYDTGNDDLIASYNAGSGKVSGNKKGPFEVSSDCPSPKTPAWQCNIDPGGFAETQNYVIKVQSLQKKCLGS